MTTVTAGVTVKPSVVEPPPSAIRDSKKKNILDLKEEVVKDLYLYSDIWGHKAYAYYSPTTTARKTSAKKKHDWRHGPWKIVTHIPKKFIERMRRGIKLDYINALEGSAENWSIIEAWLDKTFVFAKKKKEKIKDTNEYCYTLVRKVTVDFFANEKITQAESDFFKEHTDLLFSATRDSKTHIRAHESRKRLFETHIRCCNAAKTYRLAKEKVNASTNILDKNTAVSDQPFDEIFRDAAQIHIKRLDEKLRQG